MPGLSPHYELVLTRPNRLDELTVRVEARLDVAPGDYAGLAQRLRQLVKDRVGVTVACDVLAPEQLPRSQGKAQRLVDNR